MVAGCFGSSIGGVLLVNRAVRRSGRASILVMILAGIIGLGAVPYSLNPHRPHHYPLA